MFGKKVQANLKELTSRIERLNMFKKKSTVPQGKSTDELLCIYRQNAMDAMITIMKDLKAAGAPDPILLVSPVTDYVLGLEVLVGEYCCSNRPKDFYPLEWLKQQTGQIFPPMRMPPWLNIK